MVRVRQRQGKRQVHCAIRKDYFPYFTQGTKTISITGLELYDATDVSKHDAVGDPAAATDVLLGKAEFTLSAELDAPGPTQVLTRSPTAQVYLIVRYTL